MKKVLLLFVTAALTLLSGCRGEDGRDAVNIEAAVIELTNVNFIPNSFAILYSFNQPILASDQVLVYRLSASTPQGDDVWQLLPQNYYFDDGTFNFGYNYDFTRFDVNVFIDGYDLNTLTNQFTQNQILRIVVVPGYFARYASAESVIDYKDYNAVVKALGLEGKTVKSVKL